MRIRALAKMVPQEIPKEFIINAKVLFFTAILKHGYQACDFWGPANFYRICQTLSKHRFLLMFLQSALCGGSHNHGS